MKPHEKAKIRIINEWLRKANDDMAVAEHLMSEDEAFFNAITFHCQQAAEKYIKALLTWDEIDFPKTHDLEELLDLVKKSNRDIAASLRDVIILTPYGVALRYPTDRPDASREQAQEAVDLARLVRDAVLPLLPNLSTGTGQ